MSDSLPPHLMSCTQCGAELPAGGTNGLCPACLMAEAMKPTGPKKAWQPPSAEDLAKLLPQYEITRMLGRGGMGAVYQGKQKSLDRPVAIKILPAEMDDQDASFAERFKNEARAMAKLTHPGIVAVYDSGETANGMLYIVMEFIEGTDVARMIAKDKRLHTEHAMAITAHVCDALAYAHERGIIHRDIKPANIMVGYDGVVKVADFGLAKMSKAGESALTQSGMAMGTLYYMAPEALMLGTAVDHRADIYAVGVMLYQMLTGKLPQGMFELPSLQVPGLDPRYDSIIGKALREDRELRYPSTLDMRHDLDAILTQPVVKVEAAAEKAPAALETQARPQRPAGQPYRPPRPQVVVRTEKKGSPLLWLALIVTCSVAAWMFFKDSKNGDLPSPKTPPASSAATTSPAVTNMPSPSGGLASVTKSAPFVNTLGMKFVPVPGTNVLMCIHETRKSDYAAFAAETPGTDGYWKNPTLEGLKVSEGDDHPVVSVNSLDADAFCKWLSKKEGRSYRLPSWREWGWAVGTGPLEQEGATVAEMKAKVAGIYPWGRGWPPPKGAGNLGDEALKARQPTARIIAGYQDGYATTAPVMSFPPNEIGIHDLCGNVYEWCGDLSSKPDFRLVRSSHWRGFTPDVPIVSSNPGDVGQPRMLRWPDLGFRVVLELTPSSASAETVSTATPLGTPAKAATVESTKAPPMTTAKPAEVAVQEPVPLTLPTGPTNWTDTKGRSVTATFKAVASGNVLLDIAGKVTPVPLNTLSAESQKLARDYQQQTPPATATKESPFINTLGMKFVPVLITGGPTDGKRVLFSVWETRVQDYEVFAKAMSYQRSKPPFEQGPTHPVVNVSWNDAHAFCVWLTEREQKLGVIESTEHYRLPMDHEWSCAVGIGDLESPSQASEEKSGKIQELYPWGRQWPPPTGAGNFSGEEAAGHELAANEMSIVGYRDGFLRTAPVGSFAANSLGLFDLSGNAREYCEDLYTGQLRTLRGSGFGDGERNFLWSSGRGGFVTSDRLNPHFGFRVVLISSRPGLKVNNDGAASNVERHANNHSVSATKDAPFINTLGMKFVPVPITGGPTDGKRVLFSLWETRVQDYEVFVKETKREWTNPEFTQEPTHPVLMVSWDDAQAFCAWLTDREKETGRLGPKERYRLPSDHEWSCAAGIGSNEDPAEPPNAKDGKVPDVFPWGNVWPPPAGAGNYAGEELQQALAAGKYRYIKNVIAGYRDEHAETAPVGSFPPDRFGLYDLSGNAWEWCEEWFDASKNGRVLRGGSWTNYERGRLCSSQRNNWPPTQRISLNGFRCVLDSPYQAVPKSTSLPVSSSSLPTATKDAPFINTLGMKFVPVPGTDVLFCIHETRRQDFASYAEDVPNVNRSWMDQQENGVSCGAESNHPVVGVSWEEAGRFCEWLSQKEGRRYRLPTDREWSWAVGIGQQEEASSDSTPELLNGKLATIFPWGGDYPPVAKDAGNYADSAWHEKLPARPWIENFSDGFPTTAPVMSFKPSKLGLYDLGGNVWEFVQDWWNPQQQGRVIRGGSFNNVHQDLLLSSGRFRCHPTGRFNNHGFRVVLELPKP